MYHHIPTHYKRAQKETDLCEHCELLPSLKQRQTNLSQQTASLNQRDESSKPQIQSIKKQLEQVEEQITAVEFHKTLSEIQREEFKRQRESVKKGECVFVFDFKQNVKIGTGPRQVSQQYYQMQQQSVFGVIVYFYCTNSNTIKQRNIHFISSILSHDGLFASECLRLLMKKPFMTEIKHVAFWSDCRPHFRNGELAHELLVEIPELFKVSCQYNYF